MKELLSVTEAAALLHISRTAVLKRIKTGTLNAQKIGRSYVIDKDELTLIKELQPSESQKAVIERAVEKVISEYGEALRMLKDT